MKRNVKLIVYLTSITMIILLITHILNNPYFVYANTDNISITTNPEGVLFDGTNIKPGDTFERHLTVKNEGEYDFHYQSESRKVSGSDLLYEQFNLSIWDSDGTNLYEGKLANFTGFDTRLLKSGTEEELTFLAEFPPESGNEFQGLETQFVILFFAEADMPEQEDDDKDQEEQDKDQEEEDKDNGERDEENDEGAVDVGSGDDEAVKGDSVLPQTGEQIPFAYYILGGLLVVIGISIFMFRKRRT